MSIFNNADFYPTPANVIESILQGVDVAGRVFLEPSAGKGDIVDYLTANGAASVLACEISPDLCTILATKCRILGNDFLQVESSQISHIDTIVMNPPFSADEVHILHAYEIAPPGCEIVALCNYSTLSNPHTSKRKQLLNIIDRCGFFENLGSCFEDAERKTGIEVGLIRIKKEGVKQSDEFSGFFMEEEPEEQQNAGLMSYNVVRDLVNRYIAACKVYSEVLTVKKRLNALTGNFFGGDLGIQAPLNYEEYKKELQKAGWKFILKEMNLSKYTTKGVREDINRFVEQQIAVPFTMRNIYHMLDIVVQTAGQRMDKAILEVFDRVTENHHDNRYNIKGWKTNSHFLVGKKFILPYQINPAKEYGYTSDTYNSMKNSFDGIIADFEKALCFVEGIRYEEIMTVNHSINRNQYGEWYESHFFRYKGYKNGNMHYEFKDEEIWGRFNQRVAKLKGYPLYEPKPQTAYQDRNTGRSRQQQARPAQKAAAKPAKVLFEVTV